jgi:hypothetical protein
MFLSDDVASQPGTMALVPQVVDAVSVPVIAAGGIADGRGIVAALALGAAAVQIGTAYLFCPESMVTPLHRAALKQARRRHGADQRVHRPPGPRHRQSLRARGRADQRRGAAVPARRQCRGAAASGRRGQRYERLFAAVVRSGRGAGARDRGGRVDQCSWPPMRPNACRPHLPLVDLALGLVLGDAVATSPASGSCRPVPRACRQLLRRGRRR